MFESTRNPRHVRFAETTWNIFQIFTNNDVADLKIVLSNMMHLSRKKKRLPKRDLRCFVKHDGWKKTLYLKTYRRSMGRSYNVLKVLHQQMVGTATVLFTRRDFQNQ